MKKIGYNNWLINQQKEHRLQRYKKVTLFRRYWNSGNNEYDWESQATVNIDDDVIKCGKITWKSDTDLLNVWKNGNISLIMDNSHGKWDVNNSSGYFNGFTPFLSMVRVEVGFIAEDNSIYEIFSYQGLITKDGVILDNEKFTATVRIISLDYLIESANAEDVSMKPVYPEIQIFNSDIYSSTTIGKTSSGWTTNAYQYKIVRINGGTGVGQERLILSNTADTLTVNAWTTTPDSTSDFEIKGEYLGVGTGSQVEFLTVQPGVGKISRVWLNDDYKEQGNHYDVEQINEASSTAKITFKVAPSAGVRVVADYIYWYQNETFKFLIEKILDNVGITNRYVQDIVFPEGVEVTWEQTTESDWNSGTLYHANTSRVSGDIAVDDDRAVSMFDYSADSSTSGGSGLRTVGNSSNAVAMIVTPSKSGYLDNVDMYFNISADADGYIRIALHQYNGLGTDPGSFIMNNVNVISAAPSGSNVSRNAVFTSNNYRVSAGTSYWLVVYRYSYTSGTVQIVTYNNGQSWKHSAYLGGGTWDHQANNENVQVDWYYNPYYVYGSHMSQTNDCGASLASYERIYTNHTANGGTVVYYTKSNSVDSFPSTFNPAEWDPVDSFGNITSSVQRYIRVAIYFVPGYDGRTWQSGDMSTPFIHDYTIKYYVTEYKPKLANFLDKNGKTSIETMARLANYEMGFFTDFNDSDNMSWDVEYDGSVMPQSDTPAWTEVKTGTASGSIVSNKLVITSGASGGTCYYSITDSDLDPRNGWTVEANMEKVSGEDEGFGIIVNDGTYITKVIITGQGYLKLLEYDRDNTTKTKKADFSAGSSHILKISRKNSVVKLYVDNEIALMSIADNIGDISNKYIRFGHINNDSTTYEDVVDWLRYNDSVPCFETFYLPKYYFQSRENIVDTGMHLEPDENYIKLYNFNSGWSRIYNHIKADYGEYSHYANAYTEADQRPTSEDTYGKKLLSISGEDFLQAEDTNLAIGTAKVNYEYYKNPRRRFNLDCRYLFQLNLSDKVYCSCSEPFVINNLPCKVVGIVLDIDDSSLTLDLEEII